MKRYWVLKTEPDAYSWEQLEKDGQTSWTGIRNFQARNNLKEMTAGDGCFVYHSGDEKAILGLAEVVKSAYPDPTSTDGDWICVDLKAVKPLKSPVSLSV